MDICRYANWNSLRDSIPGYVGNVSPCKIIPCIKTFTVYYIMKTFRCRCFHISVLAIWVPEPTYNGPSNVVYFRTALSLEDEISRNKNITWLICFYTAWNPSCANFAPLFAQLSAEYVNTVYM